MRKLKEKSKSGNPLLNVVLILLGFGVVMVYNVSTVYAANVFGGKFYFLLLQLGWATLGILALLFFSKVNFPRVLSLSTVFLIISVCFLLFVLLPTPFSPKIYGARRWIFLNPSPLPEIPALGRVDFQPSELAKLSVIIYLSVLIAKRKEAWLNYFITLFLVTGLILLEPDLGTAAIILCVGFCIYFVSGASLKPLITGIPIFLVVLSIYILASPYRRERILTYTSQGVSDPQGSSYHINQVLIALGSGGPFGVGFGQSRQKFEYIPEVATDSIFAIIGEELGFIGALVVILAFSFVVYRGYELSKTAAKPEERLVGVGITSWFGTQCIVNLAAMVHLVPLTGIPLPLISYGGSSLVVGMAAIGILLNASSVRAKI